MGIWERSNKATSPVLRECVPWTAPSSRLVWPAIYDQNDRTVTAYTGAERRALSLLERCLSTQALQSLSKARLSSG